MCQGPNRSAGKSRHNTPHWARQSKASVNKRVSCATCSDLARSQWAVQVLTATGLGNWEPTHDTKRWQQSHVLDLLIQHTGQGDGKTLEALPLQPASVLELTP